MKIKITTTIRYFYENGHINYLKNGETWKDRNNKRKNLQKKYIYIKIWDVNVDNIVISKLVKTETNKSI